MSNAKKFITDYAKFIGEEESIGGKKYVKTMDMEDGTIFIYDKNLNRFKPIVFPSGDDVMFRDSRPIPETIGGWKKGDIINNVPLSEVIRTLLYPYETPYFTSFYIVGAPVLEIGDTLQSVVFSWVISNYRNTTLNSVTIYRGTAPIMTNMNDSPVSMELNITNTLPKQEVFKISALNSKGENFYMNTSVSWNIPIYHGVSKKQILSEEEIEAMESVLVNTLSSYTFNFIGPGYKYVAIPVCLISRTPNFKDSVSKFDVPMIEVSTVSITHKSGITNNYTLFRSCYLLNGDISINIT